MRTDGTNTETAVTVDAQTNTESKQLTPTQMAAYGTAGFGLLYLYSGMGCQQGNCFTTDNPALGLVGALMQNTVTTIAVTGLAVAAGTTERGKQEVSKIAEKAMELSAPYLATAQKTATAYLNTASAKLFGAKKPTKVEEKSAERSLRPGK